MYAHHSNLETSNFGSKLLYMDNWHFSIDKFWKWTSWGWAQMKLGFPVSSLSLYHSNLLCLLRLVSRTIERKQRWLMVSFFHLSHFHFTKPLSSFLQKIWFHLLFTTIGLPFYIQINHEKLCVVACDLLGCVIACKLFDIIFMIVLTFLSPCRWVL